MTDGIESFDPTYEELKPNRGNIIYQANASFDPTYEELKHKRARSVGFSCVVLTLPMRN